MRVCAVWDNYNQFLREAVCRASSGSFSQACISPSSAAGAIRRSAQSQPGQGNPKWHMHLGVARLCPAEAACKTLSAHRCALRQEQVPAVLGQSDISLVS